MLKEMLAYVKTHVRLTVIALMVGALVGASVMGTVSWTSGTNYSSAATATFTDVKGHWAIDAINWGVKEGVVNGYPDGTFKPNRSVAEAEFLVMLFRAFKVEPPAVKDMNHWADAYYNFAASLNYPVKGKTNFDVRNGFIKRATVAEIIAAADGVNFKGDNAIKYLLGKGYSTGTDPNSITVANFKGNDNLTRAEAVTFLLKLKNNGFKELQKAPSQTSDTTDIPALPVQPTGTQAKILAALQAKLKDSKYKGYKLVYDDEGVTVNLMYDQYTGITKISVMYASSNGGYSTIRIEDTSDSASVDLATTVAKAAGFSISASTISNVLSTKKSYNGTNISIEKSQYEYNVVFVYFK